MQSNNLMNSSYELQNQIKVKKQTFTLWKIEKGLENHIGVYKVCLNSLIVFQVKPYFSIEATSMSTYY